MTPLDCAEIRVHGLRLKAAMTHWLLHSIRKKQLFTIDFVARNHALPRGRYNPIDKLLHLSNLGLRVPGWVDNHRAVLVEQALARQIARLLDANAIVLVMPEQLSSTAQDIAHGKPTEIDHLNGFIARRGAELGVATPVNQALYAWVK